MATLEDTDIITTIRLNEVDTMLTKYITDNNVSQKYKTDLFRHVLRVSTHPKVKVDPQQIIYIVSEIEALLKSIDCNKLQ